MQQFVVEADHQRAEAAPTHKVAAQHVDSAHLTPGPLFAGPAEQERESLRRHGLHGLERVTQHVGGVLGQVQAADVKSSCERCKHTSGSCMSLPHQQNRH